MVPAKLPPSCTRRWGCGPVPVVPRSCRCRAQRSRYRAGASGRRTRPVSLSASLTADPTDTPAAHECRDAKHRGCPRGGNHSDDLRDHVPDVGCDINVERWTGKWHQTIREGGSGYVEVAGSRGYRDDLVPVGYCVTDTVRSCAGDYSWRVRRCGLQVIHSCVAAAGQAADLAAFLRPARPARRA
jgi:hypothetical protein